MKDAREDQLQPSMILLRHGTTRNIIHSPPTCGNQTPPKRGPGCPPGRGRWTISPRQEGRETFSQMVWKGRGRRSKIHSTQLKSMRFKQIQEPRRRRFTAINSQRGLQRRSGRRNHGDHRARQCLSYDKNTPEMRSLFGSTLEIKNPGSGLHIKNHLALTKDKRLLGSSDGVHEPNSFPSVSCDRPLLASPIIPRVHRASSDAEPSSTRKARPGGDRRSGWPERRVVPKPRSYLLVPWSGYRARLGASRKVRARVERRRAKLANRVLHGVL